MSFNSLGKAVRNLTAGVDPAKLRVLQNSGYTDEQIKAYIEGQQKQAMSNQDIPTQIIPVTLSSSNTTTVPLPNAPCKRLTAWEKALLVVDHSTIDLSYGRPLYCELLKKLHRSGRLSTLSWADIEPILPSTDLTGSVKTVNVSGHDMDYAQIVEFIRGLKKTYPAFQPNTLIVGGNKGLDDSEVLAALQDILRKVIPDVSLKLQAGGRRTRRRKSRKSRKSRHR